MWFMFEKTTRDFAVGQVDYKLYLLKLFALYNICREELLVLMVYIPSMDDFHASLSNNWVKTLRSVQ